MQLGLNTNIKISLFIIIYCFICLIGYVDDKIDISLLTN